LKAETYRFLRLAQPTDEERADGAAVPPGAIHLPAWIDSKWCKQLVGEELVTVRTRRGFARLEWQKLRERNEALDCPVYARASGAPTGRGRCHSKQRVPIVGANPWPLIDSEVVGGYEAVVAMLDGAERVPGHRGTGFSAAAEPRLHGSGNGRARALWCAHENEPPSRPCIRRARPIQLRRAAH
jgi:hypothetical protein